MSENCFVIAAIRGKESLLSACKSKVKIIFDLEPNIETVEQNAMLCREYGKTYFVHMDLAEGIGKDKFGLRFVKKMGVNGIISTRANLIKIAKDMELKTVQRIFILDSQSLKTAESVLKTGPDMVEIMPGIIPVAIKELSSMVDIPIIAGGLIRDKNDVEQISKAGAVAVSTSNSELW
ncbi:MAG: glycerol-3-phosphate responsive antiterminator [Clostridia bacterium]|nr:glycerol-3-phosphate responsive antiterminator [Clostridia bacterium]